MSTFTFKNIKISGIASAVPKNVIKPADFKPSFGDEEVERFMTMTGIRSARRTSDHQTASDLAYTAAKALIDNFEIDEGDIGALVFGTHSPDYRRPASAFIIQKRLGLPKEAVVFDISLGCSSAVYGLQVVSSLMSNSDIKKAILVVGDTAGKTVYPKDKASAMLIGEGSAAFLLEKDENAEDIHSILRSDGEGYRYLIVPAGGYRNLNASKEPMMCKDGVERTLYNSFMQGTSVFTFTIFDVPKIIKDFMRLTNTTVDDYDCFAFHQANLLILKQIAKKLSIPMEKMPITLLDYGNTSGASTALSLCKRYGNEKGEDINVLLTGFGVGLSWGITSFKINKSNILPIIEDDSVFEEGIINDTMEL